MSTPRHLECCVCGNGAGRWQQHWNRDAGYGICRSCVEWVAKPRGEHQPGYTPAEIADLYGIEGVNYAPAATPAEGVGT
jgi:hypothetical protein